MRCYYCFALLNDPCYSFEEMKGCVPVYARILEVPVEELLGDWPLDRDTQHYLQKEADAHRHHG